MREPHWRGPGDTDWGLSPLSSTRGETRRPLPRRLGDIRRHHDARRVGKALRAVDDLRVSLGSGREAPEGWYGLDVHHRGERILRADLTRGLPIARHSASALLAEHFVEHLFLDDISALLVECLRVLRPRAPMRIVCPDANQVARLLEQGHAGERQDPMIRDDVEMHRWPDDGLNWARTVNRISHQWGQHRSLVTAEMVVQLMRHAGFVDVVSLPVAETRHLAPRPPDLHGVRFPDEAPDANFAVEGLAPSADAARG